MNSLYRPQSESVDSTRILVSTKQKQKSKINQITGIKSLNRTQSQEYGCDTHPKAAYKCNSGLTNIQIDHPSPRLTLCQENLRK